MTPRTVARARGRRSHVRRLIARPGARFACRGDGLCCTDAHALGPVARSEARAIGLDPRHSLVLDDGIDAHALRTDEGRCHLLVVSREDNPASPTRCKLHEAGGSFAKPDGCRRFPYGLVATPHGGRITTAHRCPCRSLTDAESIDLDDARRSLVDRAGRLRADLRAEDRVHATRHRRIAFDRYVELEAESLARLRDGGDAESSLRGAAFPDLGALHWEDVAHLLRSRIDGSACGDALAWAGDSLLAILGRGRRPPRRRPWTPSFDRAEHRSPGRRTSDAVRADWLSDEIWSLSWLADWPLDLARAELATRARLADDIARTLEIAGAWPGRAMAEAVLIAEIVGESRLWRSVIAGALR